MSDQLRLPTDVILPTNMDPTVRAVLTDIFRQINTQINRTAQRVITVTANHTAAEDLVVADASGGSFTVTLPAVATWVDKTITVKRPDASAVNDVTISTATGDGAIIEGVSSTHNYLHGGITSQYRAITFMSDGENWWVTSGFGNNAPS